MKHIVKYLQRTKDTLLLYGMGDIHVDGYIDSDFQSNINDHKSMSGFVYFLNGDAMS